MKPVFQTRFGKHKGNCLTACVASILEVEISDLPEFCDNDQWFSKLAEFCHSSGLLLMFWRHLPDLPIIVLNAHLIMILELKGTEDYHSVIVKTIQGSITPFKDEEVETTSIIEDVTGSKPDGEQWSWTTELIHDPNPGEIPPVTGTVGYLLIAKQ